MKFVKILMEIFKYLSIFLILLFILFYALAKFIMAPTTSELIELKSGACIHIVNNGGDEGRPGYGSHIYAQPGYCCLASISLGYCSDQIFGDYCKSLKVVERGQTLKIQCQSEKNESTPFMIREWGGYTLEETKL